MSHINQQLADLKAAKVITGYKYDVISHITIKTTWKELRIVKPDYIETLHAKWMRYCESCGLSKIEVAPPQTRDVIVGKAPYCHSAKVYPDHHPQPKGEVKMSVVKLAVYAEMVKQPSPIAPTDFIDKSYAEMWKPNVVPTLLGMPDTSYVEKNQQKVKIQDSDHKGVAEDHPVLQELKEKNWRMWNGWEEVEEQQVVVKEDEGEVYSDGEDSDLELSDDERDNEW